MPFKPSIKIISVPKPSDQVTHHVIVHVLPKLNPNQKVLVEVSNKVYLAQNNVADVKIIKPFNNEAIINSSIPDIQVKVFVYDSLNDKITNAYSQLFEYSTILATLNSTDIIKSTVPNIVSDWSKFKVKKKKNIANKKFTKRTKTKVHFTIGIFFDGTGNNRHNSEKVYYEKLNRKDLVYTSVPEVKELANGKKIDSGSSYWNPYSNVALLHDLYKIENEKGTIISDGKSYVTIKQYVQGIGTLEDEKDDFWGTALGEKERGIIGKVIEASNNIATEITKILGNDKEIGSITFDVFGFSRGAAAARHFCNEILGKESITDLFKKLDKDSSSKNQGNTRINQQNAYLPIGFNYNLGRLGISLKQLKTQNSIDYYFEEAKPIKTTNIAQILENEKKIKKARLEKSPVKIRFLGIFDTVVSQMIIKNHLGKKVDIASLVIPAPIKLPLGVGSLVELAIDKVKQKIDNLPIQQIVHLIAKDEWRTNFALTKAGKGKNIFEVILPGTHSDIGGGYMAKKQDIDIVEYEYVTTFEKSKIPTSNRLHKLKKFYIDNGYIKNDNEIKIINKLIYEEYNNDWNTTKYHYLKQLVITRKIIPRYSVINMKVMKVLAIEKGLVFNDSIPKYEFELDTPNELKQYEKELIEKLKLDFQGKKSKSIKSKLQKNKFIHLSSSYNTAAIFDNPGSSLTGINTLDELLYFNAPKYTNEKKDNYYIREVYTHRQ